MRLVTTLLALAAALALAPNFAQAGDANTPQSPPSGPSKIISGSGDVSVEGKEAARAGDSTGNGTVVEGSSNVFINGKPAAIQGSKTGCAGSVVTGSSSVFINGKPMATAGDSTACPGQ
ncbi:MAG TPA: PAAR domain-containing protein [Methyloceanibacter sp.]|jgi:uncharacterized Zn-binding protein involved in type VI secretion